MNSILLKNGILQICLGKYITVTHWKECIFLHNMEKLFTLSEENMVDITTTKVSVETV